MPTNEGVRLQVGRLVKSIELEQMADDLGIDINELNEYETGDDEVPPEFLWDVSDYLNIELSYFLRQLPLTNVTPVSDALDKLSPPEQDQVIAQAVFWLEHYLDLESFIPVEEIPVGEYPDGFPMAVESPKQAAEAAELLRIAWDLGRSTPLSDLSATLSRLGFKVGAINGTGQFDAAALLSSGDFPLPIIVMRAGLAGDLQRFAMARELAYFMLQNPTRQIASHFAGSLLMPADVLRTEMGEGRTQIELAELYMLKTRYGMSMRFLLTRLASLRLIPKETYEFWMQRFRDEAWVLAEPGGEYTPEGPTFMLQMAMRLMAEGEISQDRAAEMLEFDPDTWEIILSLGAGLITAPEDDFTEELG